MKSNVEKLDNTFKAQNLNFDKFGCFFDVVKKGF